MRTPDIPVWRRAAQDATAAAHGCRLTCRIAMPKASTPCMFAGGQSKWQLVVTSRSTMGGVHKSQDLARSHDYGQAVAKVETAEVER